MPERGSPVPCGAVLVTPAWSCRRAVTALPPAEGPVAAGFGVPVRSAVAAGGDGEAEGAGTKWDPNAQEQKVPVATAAR